MDQTKIRYTTDNRKVLIIEDLNSSECIVQEVYINDITNEELLSGERFVCSKIKLRTTEPYVTWKAKRVAQADEQYNKWLPKIKEETEKFKSEYIKVNKKHTLLVNKAKEYEKTTNCSEFETIRQFLQGEIKYVVVEEYFGYKILSLEDILLYEGSLKLLTLFGKAGCGLSWNLNRYSDGSGTYKMLYPCTTKEAAINKLDELIGERIKERTEFCITKEMLIAQREYNLSNPTVEQRVNFCDRLIVKEQKKIQEYKDKIVESEEQIKKIKEELGRVR